jgi:hypothetical protein
VIPGFGLAMAWSPDGIELIHDWHPGKSPYDREGTPRTYRVRLQKSKPVPPDAVVKAVPAASKEDEIVAAILSESSARVSWGVEHAREAPSGRVISAMCTALPSWFPREGPCAGEMVEELSRLDAREAIPFFRNVILIRPEVVSDLDGGSRKYRLQYQPNAVCSAITALMQWNVKESVDELRKYVQRFPDLEPAVYAVGALAVFGDEERWQQLTLYKTSADREIRSRLAGVLSLIRDPRAVDILLDLVNDRERLYDSADGETQVGDQAVGSLKILTGQEYGRDPDAWRAWWAKQDRKLPNQSVR